MKINGKNHLSLAQIVVYSSDDGENWDLVKPEDVPNWVKDPDVMGWLVKGNMCRNDVPNWVKDPEARKWYRAERLS